ncbi:hypothetical protein P389DRAFT_156183 [Cystobasidium minutum MCA 4210]|uniref:uncharacterized protein n=1 Tax=Cystobasidium minutum MCA 4210 TaxID=1397322 RepID=UPI0034CDE443|eukprot:jgi/Rhomi1/156183/estExt_Genewise1.C_100170
MQTSLSSQSTAQQPSLHTLGTLLKRLEAATSRLEDIAIAQQSQQLIGNVPGPSGGQQQSTATAPAAAAPSTAGAAAGGSGSDAQEDIKVKAFQELIDGPLKKYGELSSDIGGLVAEQAKQVVNCFAAQLDFVQAATKCKQIPPSDPSFMTLLGPTQQALMKVTEIKESNRASKQFNHLSEVAEGIPALAWVTLDSKPVEFVGQMKDAAQFYANRVVKEFKDSDPKQVEWARSYVELLDELKKYVKAHQTTGLVWNKSGQDVASYLASKSSSSSAPAPPAAPKASGAPAPPPPPPAGGAPAPPPPPPAGGSAPAAPSSKPKADISAVFADLNKGETVTKGLRHVDRSEMTHKNPSLRAAGAGSDAAGGDKAGSRPAIPKKPASFQHQPQKKPAVCNLEGTKWRVEHHDGNREIIIDGTEIGHTVNIFGCKNSVIQIKGKVNAVSLVSSPKTSILLESTVSSIEITNSPSFTVQVLGTVPTILVDSTDGGQIYLSKDSMNVEIITSKTSGLNISLPLEGGEEGEFVEKAVPEQMKTTVGKDGKLKTEIVEHAG